MKMGITADQYIEYAPLVAERLLGKPNPHHSKKEELRYGTNGSLKVNLKDGLWHCFETGEGGGILKLIVRQGEARTEAEAAEWLVSEGFHNPEQAPAAPVKLREVAAYDYADENGELLFQVVRYEPKTFRQRRRKGKGWEFKVAGVRQVPYRLPQLLQQPDALVFIPEGEKDVDNLVKRHLVATCNAGGSGKWPIEINRYFTGRDVVILADNDAAGEKHQEVVTDKLKGVAKSIRVLRLPGLPEKGDVSDWLDAGGTADELVALAESAPIVGTAVSEDNLPESVREIRKLNESHALVIVGDKPIIMRETVGARFGKEIQYMSTGGFRTWLANKKVFVDYDIDQKPVFKRKPLADLWLESEERRQYEGVTFAPANNAPDCYYNLWSGYSVQPLNVGLAAAAMKCRRLLRHMKYVLCCGNKEHFRYLLAWAADMVQDPDNKKGTALVMRGLKGTGKSTFTDFLNDLLGRHAIKVTQMRHLVGNFNRHLADKLLVVAEETFWAGDKSDEGPLKDMITSDTIAIEAKGVDTVQMPSMCRIAMITNNEWAVPASTDERRYFVLDVSDKRRQDFDYFAAIHEQMEANGKEGLRALLTVLLGFPLKGMNLRKVPETDGLRKQRALSLEPHDQFIYDSICGGEMAGNNWVGIITIEKDVAYASYIEASRSRGKSHLLTKEQFSKKFIAATGAKPVRPRKGYDRVQAFQMPTLEDAAAFFSEYSGVDVEITKYDEETKPF